MLRFGFMGNMLPARDVVALLESLAGEVDAYGAVLVRCHTAAAATMPLSGLDLEPTRWVRRAVARFRKEG
jgi:hypothetical protein